MHYFIVSEVCTASNLFLFLPAFINIFLAYFNHSDRCTMEFLFDLIFFLWQLLILNICLSDAGHLHIIFWRNEFPNLFPVSKCCLITLLLSCSLITCKTIVNFMPLCDCIYFYVVYGRGLYFFEAWKSLTFMITLDCVS